MSTTRTMRLLYGAYGYTGRLAAELAAAAGLPVILAGRNEAALAELGDRLHLPTRVVGLDDATKLADALHDIACVVHMAGPFATTSAPMLNACVATHTNYVDITGEIEVFEDMWARKDEIARAEITALPGSGFDVVPSDCLAGYVAGRLEQPTSLVMALSGLESASQGTLRTAIRQASRPALCRRAGAIVAINDPSPRWIDFGEGEQPCVPVSWGDVATAFHSTGIRDITVYLRRSKLIRGADLLGRSLGPLLRSRIGQRALSKLIHHFPEGPAPAERSRHRSAIWAQTANAAGSSFTAMVFTPDPYDFAANAALEISSRIVSLPEPLGLVTPFQAFGADFVLSLPGCARKDVFSGPGS